MIIQLRFENGTDRTVPAAIRAKLPVLVAALAERVTWWMLRLQQKIQQEKLSGQVLEHRTGKLFGSINAKPTEQSGSQLIGSVEGAGGPAWYGQLYEPGGGEYSIKAHLRRQGFNKKGELIKMLRRDGSLRAAVASVKQHQVQASKTFTHPVKPFMYPALAEIADAMVADLQKTAGQAIQ